MKTLPVLRSLSRFGIGLIGATALLTAVSYAQPRMEIIGGKDHDFGTTSADEAHGIVQITNIGTDTLHITNVRPSCHCTVAPLDRSDLLPGDTGTVHVTIDVKGRYGEQKKFLTITSNDPGQSSVMASVKVNVVRDLQVWPVSFPFVQGIDVGTEKEVEVEVRNTGTSAVTVEAPKLEGGPNLKVRFDPAKAMKLEPGDTMKLKAYVTPQVAGSATGDVVVKTSSKTMPDLHIGLFCNAKAQTANAAAGVAAPVPNKK